MGKLRHRFVQGPQSGAQCGLKVKTLYYCPMEWLSLKDLQLSSSEMRKLKLSWINTCLAPARGGELRKSVREWKARYHCSRETKPTVTSWGKAPFSRWAVSDSLRPHGLQHARLPCPSPAPGPCSRSRPLSQRCRPTISSSVVPFPSCPQSFPASASWGKTPN